MDMSVSGFSASPAQTVTGSSMRMPPAQKMSNLFDQIDVSGSGSITKAQFEQAFQTLNPPRGFQQQGVDAIWAKLDPNNTGSVSKQNFTTAMTQMMSQLRHHHHHHGASQGSTSVAPSSGAASGAISTVGSQISVSA